ncbi:Spy/CpxP family protein refolding chaperone [Legionella feeleii]|uniref:16 kD immunogenic protein n=1 Tax=Legionella feeleii TaxID=453 RepID=A0A0W0U361_9GAMM|nr:Spy/CpxP family protein refolding chaperone [Legionella feeleii]KTD01913.1 16 kD immunogenic protein [Legionella feeleii]SPX59434.1 16 kD immunogenic protein [Legionella feeleii]
MTKRIFTAITLAFSLFAAQTLVASTSTQVTQGCNCCVGGMGQILKALNLNADQQAKIKAIKAQLKSDTKDTWAQLDDVRGQINALIQSGQVDEAQLDSLVDKKMELLGKGIKTKIKARNQMYNVLTVEQKNQFQSLLKQQMEKRKQLFKACH